jgi:hypothetical protein
MALALRPEVLIADEPTTALDVTVQREVLDLLRDLQRGLGTAIILITHDMGVVAETADRVIIMRAGQMVEEGAVGDIFARPQMPYTQALLAAVPRMGTTAARVAPKADPIARLSDVQVRYDIHGGILGRVTARVHAVEHPFELSIGEWTVRGKIDRIDLHADGRVRLLDYKTSETAKSPAEAHMKEFKRTPLREKYPVQAWMERGKAGAVWLNLQLPLYMAYWRQAHPVESLECGYVQLPNSLEAVEFSLWKGFDPGLESGAMACAGAILEALEQNDRTVIPLADCWKREPWSEWFPGGPGASLSMDKEDFS